MKKKYENRKEVRDTLVSIPLSNDEKQHLKQLAYSKGLTTACYLRMILFEALEKEKEVY